MMKNPTLESNWENVIRLGGRESGEFDWLFTPGERAEAEARLLARNAFDRRHRDAHMLKARGERIAWKLVERSTRRRQSLRQRYWSWFKYFPEGDAALDAAIDEIVERATFGGRLAWRRRKPKPGSRFDGWIDRQWECYYASWIERRVAGDLLDRLRDLRARTKDVALVSHEDKVLVSGEDAVLVSAEDEVRAAETLQAVQDSEAAALLEDLADGSLHRPGDSGAVRRARQRLLKTAREKLQRRLAGIVDTDPRAWAPVAHRPQIDESVTALPEENIPYRETAAYKAAMLKASEDNRVQREKARPGEITVKARRF